MKCVLTIPAFNEENYIAETVETLRSYLRSSLPQHDFLIVIADNGSTDNTQKIGERLEQTHPNVTYMRINKKGKGRAVRHAWEQHDADIYIFVDADLAFGTETIGRIIKALEDGSPLAIVSRFTEGAAYRQTIVRKITTRGYNTLLHILFKHTFKDAQAGSKGIRKEVRDTVLPHVYDNRWFFDTELLLKSEKSGYTITEIPPTNSDPRPKLPSISTAFYLFIHAVKLRLQW